MPSEPRASQTHSLAARLSGVRVVFLYRFVDEVLLYISGLLAMTPPPPPLPPWAAEYVERERREAEEQRSLAAMAAGTQGAVDL